MGVSGSKPAVGVPAARVGPNTPSCQSQVVTNDAVIDIKASKLEYMQGTLIDGNSVAGGIQDKLRRQIAKLSVAPQLVVVLVGDSPASLTYINKKSKAAAECGIRSRVVTLNSDINQRQLLDVIEDLNEDDDVDGIIIQLPLPAHLDEKTATSAVAMAKDVDGFQPASIGATVMNGHEPLFCPCTPKGCLALIKDCGVALKGKEAVVIGARVSSATPGGWVGGTLAAPATSFGDRLVSTQASNIVGLPMGALLLKEGMTVTTCTIHTVDCQSHARRADVLVVAVGKAGLVTSGWVKPGAIVIDVGINHVPDASRKTGRRLVGDVDFDDVKRVAGFLTPVPGGVGPMTVAMLLSNTLDAYRQRRQPSTTESRAGAHSRTCSPA